MIINTHTPNLFLLGMTNIIFFFNYLIKNIQWTHKNGLVSFSPLLLSRAEELETALMEMVEQDNRRQLSAKVYLKLI